VTNPSVHGCERASTAEVDVKILPMRMPMRMPKLTRPDLIQNAVKNACLLGSIATLTVVQVGCAASGKSVITGRIIAGNVGQAVSAAPEDVRFEEPGIPGAKVIILNKEGNASRGRGVYTRTVSDEFGNFEIAFANGQFPRDAVRVRVEGEGIYTSRSETYLPSKGDKLLCVVMTRPGYVIPEPPPEKSPSK